MKEEYEYTFKYGGYVHKIGTNDPDFKFDEKSMDTMKVVFGGDVAKVILDKKEKYTWDKDTLVSKVDVTPIKEKAIG